MRYLTTTGTIALCLMSLSAHAQQAPKGAEVTASSPGKAAAAQTIKASAVVTAIDKANRTFTLKEANGSTFDVAADDSVRNFDQLKVKDEVVVQYVRALTLEVKPRSGAARASGSADAVRTPAGAKPGGAVARQVTVVADVIDVNQAASTISLRGPKGNVVVLNVRNPDHFKVVKKGDQVEAVYTEALAISVERAPKR